MSGIKGMKHYPKATKLEAVCMFLEEGLTRAEVVEALGLPRRDLHDLVLPRFSGQMVRSQKVVVHRHVGSCN